MAWFFLSRNYWIPLDHDLIDSIWEKDNSILAGNLNSGRSYLITAVQEEDYILLSLQELNFYNVRIVWSKHWETRGVVVAFYLFYGISSGCGQHFSWHSVRFSEFWYCWLKKMLLHWGNFLAAKFGQLDSSEFQRCCVNFISNPPQFGLISKCWSLLWKIIKPCENLILTNKCDLTLFQLGKHTFYHHDSVSSDNA